MLHEIWRRNPDDDVIAMIQPHLNDSFIIEAETAAFHAIELTDADAQAIETAIENELLPAITDFFPLQGPNFEPVG